MEVQQQRVPLITTQQSSAPNSKVQNGNSAANNANNTLVASCNCGASIPNPPNNTSSADLSSKSPSSQMPKPSSISVPSPVLPSPKNKQLKESSATQTSPTKPPTPPPTNSSSNNIDQVEETSASTIEKSKEIGTQTKTQWLQISLNSPPLSLTQEVPDVVL